jgi:hypothetical protein
MLVACRLAGLSALERHYASRQRPSAIRSVVADAGLEGLEGEAS